MALAQYDRARERVSQAANSEAQAGMGALRRRLAASGALNSGAGIQAQAQAQERATQAKAGQLADVDAQEQGEIERRAEVQANRDFQAGEAQKGRDFTRDFEGGYRDKVFEFDKMTKLRSLDQADRQIGLQESESAFNRRLAKKTAGSQGGFFGAGGFLGLGFNQNDTSDLG